MPLTNPNKVVTEERLSEFYGQILPYMGGMPDVLANKFSKGDLYSTDEKMIGCWVDNKPLYQKSFTNITVVGSSGRSYKDIVDLSSCNIDTFVDAWGRWNDSGISKPYSMSDQNNRQTLCYNTSTHYLQLLQYEGASSMVGWITIVYTKTTDSPIAIGLDTDYSTEEKIVGTWIDGSPIWQKTVSFTVPSSYTEVSLGVSNAGVAFIVFDSSYVINPYNGTQYVPLGTAWNGSAGTSSMLWRKTNGLYLYGQFLNDWVGKAGVITIRYTKTTD